MMAEFSPANARGWTRRAFASLAQWPDWLRLAVEGWRERSRLRREFDGLRQQGELDRTLIDSGIAPSDVYRLMRSYPHTREQMAQMMQRLGIERAALPRSPTVLEELRAMEWRCGECADWRKCRTWLDAGDAPGSYRAFCPNAETLDQLRTSGASFRKPCGVLAELAAAKGSDGTRD
jgi:hypothetical protein